MAKIEKITSYTRKNKKGYKCMKSGGVSVYPGGVRVYVPYKYYLQSYLLSAASSSSSTVALQNVSAAT